MIYPIPQKMNLNGEHIFINGINVYGSFQSTVEKVLQSYGISTDGEFEVETVINNSKKTTYIDSLSKLSDEKYFIYISEKKAIIEAATKRGVFRAVNTLAKLIKHNELSAGEIEDYPLFQTRGYIEGFYGPTWENGKRISVMQLMAAYGMNTYHYAPKDDLYHREKWREPYPEKELNELKKLFETAGENELDFSWSIGPGLTYRYTSDSDFEQLINKLKNVYSIGVRNFGLLLDDIPWDFQYKEDAAAYDSIVDAHIALINKVYTTIIAFDSSITLTVCPTEYFGDESSYYISKLGQNIPSDVKLFWTGAEICSRIQTSREATEFLRSTAHRPLYWDNYPVNDAEMFQEMHLGPIRGRDKDLYKHCEGLISNVMEYAECSKLPLITVADYLWNPESYNPDESIKNAQYEILGDKAEIFSYIADHLSVSCVQRHASELMSDTLSHINFLEATDRKAEAMEEFSVYISKMRECLGVISDTSVPMFAEMQKWVKKFSMCCDLLDSIYAVWESPDENKKAELSALLDKYNSDAVILTGFCLREQAEKTLRM